MTAPNDLSSPESRPRSRRALLAGALGGLGALAASAVGRVSPVAAADGQAVIQGEVNNAASLTTLTNTTGTDLGDAFKAVAGGTSGFAVTGVATGGIGIRGLATTGAAIAADSDNGSGLQAVSQSGIGVEGQSFSGIGVAARSTGNYALHALSTQATAGRLQTNSQFGAGVEVEVNHATNGRGAIEAHHKGSGPAVWATATKGHALRGSGRLRFDKVSGVATIPAGSTGVTISPGVNVTGGSFVLLTPRANIGSRGLWYVPNATANTFRIRMSSSRSSNTKVAWLLLG